MKDNQLLSSRGIIDGYQPLAVIQPLQEPVADTIRLAMLQNRSFPVTHREGFATCCQRHSIALRMQGIGIKKHTGRYKLPTALRTYTGKFYLKMTCVFSLRIEEIEISRRVIHKPLTIS